MEQAVLAYLKLSDSEHGTEKEREAIFKLEDELEKKIGVASAGEYDGNEFGGGFATLYMYGPDANKLFDVIIETIRQYKPREGSYLIKRYGKPGKGKKRLLFDPTAQSNKRLQRTGISVSLIDNLPLARLSPGR